MVVSSKFRKSQKAKFASATRQTQHVYRNDVWGHPKVAYSVTITYTAYASSY